jgi:hypothetical protein
LVELQVDSTFSLPSIAIWRARSNRLADLKPLVPVLLRVLSKPLAGEVVFVDG